MADGEMDAWPVPKGARTKKPPVGLTLLLPGRYPAAVLSELIHRVRPKVTDWDVGGPLEDDPDGQCHLAAAFRQAAAALEPPAAGIGARAHIAAITDAAFRCTALEHRGSELARQYELAQRQRKGGKASAAVKQVKAAERWQQWLARATETTTEQAMSALRRDMMKANIPPRSIRRILRQVK